MGMTEDQFSTYWSKQISAEITFTIKYEMFTPFRLLNSMFQMGWKTKLVTTVNNLEF